MSHVIDPLPEPDSNRSARWHGSDHHPPCPGGCGELADECMTPGCGSPLGSMRIDGEDGFQEQPRWVRDESSEPNRRGNHQ